MLTFISSKNIMPVPRKKVNYNRFLRILGKALTMEWAIYVSADSIHSVISDLCYKYTYVNYVTHKLLRSILPTRTDGYTCPNCLNIDFFCWVLKWIIFVKDACLAGSYTLLANYNIFRLPNKSIKFVS